MKIATIAASAAAMMLALSAAPILAAETNTSSGSPALAELLNKANQMNHEEIDVADMAKDKVGDNHALEAMAETIKEDHEANESAVKALASDKNVTLNSYKKNTEEENKLSNLKGEEFDRAFLMGTIRDHRQALHEFEQARTNTTDPAVRMYIDETTPVLESHLKMAENLRRDMTAENGTQAHHTMEQASSR